MSQALTNPGLASEQEAKFVAVLLDLGGPQHAAEAALRAGYAATKEDAARAAAFLLANARISRAIKSEMGARFTAASGAALTALLDVCQNGQSESARIMAANSILDRGVGPVISRSAVITAHTTVEDWLDKLDAAEN